MPGVCDCPSDVLVDAYDEGRSERLRRANTRQLGRLLLPTPLQVERGSQQRRRRPLLSVARLEQGRQPHG